MSAPKLSAHLSAVYPTAYVAATTHVFLKNAANLSLSSDSLAYWLFQDRIYAAHAYPRFIAQLIAKIPLDSFPSYYASDLGRRTLAILVECLNNVVREVNFFEETAKKYGLNIGGVEGQKDEVWMVRKATRDYIAEMARVGALRTLEDGLVFLWAMEKVYLDAWTTVHAAGSSKPESSDPTVRAIRELSLNWSSANEHFKKFVKDIQDVLDEYYEPVMCAATGAGGGQAWGKDVLARAESIWARVVELEDDFWPEKGEETLMRHAAATRT
ncbi:heme oxygenase-like protein [Phlebopus sp. FC_14]|nr:heme oxygenase-like protein [Phlebopus sp. FC_14]